MAQRPRSLANVVEYCQKLQLDLAIWRFLWTEALKEGIDSHFICGIKLDGAKLGAFYRFSCVSKSQTQAQCRPNRTS